MDFPYDPLTEPLEAPKTHRDVRYQTYYWQPTVAIRGRVLFVHGFRDDVRCYWELIDMLNAHGYGFFYYDQVGEGKTVGVDLASTATILNTTSKAHESLEFFVTYQISEMKFHDEPENLHIMSHSNGGGIALTYLSSLQTIPEQIKSVSSIGPLIELVKPVPSWVTNWIGSALVCTNYGCQYRVGTPMTAEDCSSDPKVVEWLRSDLTGLDAAFLETRDAILRGKLLQDESSFCWTGQIPLLLCHGSEDPVTKNESSKKLVEQLTRRGFGNVKYIPYAGGVHSLHMDSDSVRRAVCCDLLSFIMSSS